MKQYLIDTIEALWPADSEYPDTRRDGGELLRRAIYNTYPNWRDMPVEVLEEYARLCMRKEWYCDFEIEQWWEGYLESKAEQSK